MNANQLKAALDARPFRFLEQTESTNADAKKWLSLRPWLPSGAVVVADEQTQGRGRRGRQWETPPGDAVAMSVILREPTPERLPMLAGLAIREAVQTRVDSPVALKWPNDVLIKGKKVGGILVESITGVHPRAHVLGIGLNVRVDFTATRLEGIATSLEDHSSSRIDRVEVIRDILDALDEEKDRDDTMERWKQALNTLGKVVTLASGKEDVTGRAVDVDENGALGIRTSNGEVRYFAAGDVTLRKNGAGA